MAMNSKRLEEIKKREKQKRYEKELGKTTVFPIFVLLLTLITALLMLVNFASVYNTDINGNEVEISGYNCLIAFLSGNYSSASTSVGDMAVPFYYYAKAQCEALGLLCFIAVALMLVTFVLAAMQIVNKKSSLMLVISVLSIALTVVMLCAFTEALSMADSKILPVYCSGNPACSIRSLAMLPTLTSMASGACSVVGYIKRRSVEKIICD